MNVNMQYPTTFHKLKDDKKYIIGHEINIIVCNNAISCTNSKNDHKYGPSKMANRHSSTI
jgi:hypothetical protein